MYIGVISHVTPYITTGFWAHFVSTNKKPNRGKTDSSKMRHVLYAPQMAQENLLKMVDSMIDAASANHQIPFIQASWRIIFRNNFKRILKTIQFLLRILSIGVLSKDVGAWLAKWIYMGTSTVPRVFVAFNFSSVHVFTKYSPYRFFTKDFQSTLS